MLQLIQPKTFGKLAFDDIKGPHGHYGEEGYKYITEWPAEERLKMVDTFYKFIFVRHPLERILSAYRFASRIYIESGKSTIFQRQSSIRLPQKSSFSKRGKSKRPRCWWVHGSRQRRFSRVCEGWFQKNNISDKIEKFLMKQELVFDQTSWLGCWWIENSTLEEIRWSLWNLLIRLGFRRKTGDGQWGLSICTWRWVFIRTKYLS